ncbi:hypothetical protein [Mycolicibacterium madagascariense]|uniref:hypothetical protein n=1 Tax=Mycolicibacterium madagascariense TaxID=212765 RepID=UPI0013D24C7A|nr:hypothetical protein [Mycolicibacterium madagascariense]MCV7014177.1 hypothetical protein [Mycolicibacterium madagascariense]
MSRYLAASVLSALPHTTGSARGTRRREDSLLRLRRAMAFIEEHADVDLSLGRIATATDTTTESLRYLFRRYRDCTPRRPGQHVGEAQHAYSLWRSGIIVYERGIGSPSPILTISIGGTPDSPRPWGGQAIPRG